MLSNATKFQNEGEIKIFTSIYFDGDAEFIDVTVKDNGPGMSMGQLADVFKPVKKDVNNSSRYISNGVGLSICKQICE